MKDFFRSVKFKILVCVFALLFGLMIYAAIAAGAASVPEMVLSAVTQPFVSAATAITDWAEGTIDKFANADKYKQENEILRRQLSEMYGQIMDRDSLAEENAQLKSMLKIAEENDDFEWSAPCSIIARNSNDIFGGFTINRGENDGIALYDPVFTDVGLVGIISKIAPTYAKVTTILSTEINIGVMTTKSNIVGIIENDIIFSQEGKCLMSSIAKGSGIAVGDVIVTSGGVVYPDGLVVGTVEKIYDDENGLSVHAVIEPSEKLSSITDVYVITAFDGQGVETEK